MKSDVCKLSQNLASLEVILNETEKAASYANLDKKQILRLRLLAEELVGMLPELLSFGTGEFWIEAEGKNFELHTVLTPSSSMTAEKREKILSVATDGKNAAAVGIMSKIKLAAEFMMIDYSEVAAVTNAESDFFSMGAVAMPTYPMTSWSLSTYRTKSEEKKGDDWDELEKSIIANIADDVIVGVQGKKVEVVVKKQM